MRKPLTTFSEDRRHRYTLWREWDLMFGDSSSPRFVNFICLNPSTATETLDDPTIKRCIRFSKRWGYDAMCVTNIFAYRATNPVDMMVQDDPVGPDNDAWLRQVATDASLVIAAWSGHASFKGRSSEVRALLREIGKPVHYLKMGSGKNPEPWHPLYLPNSTEPVPWATI